MGQVVRVEGNGADDTHQKTNRYVIHNYTTGEAIETVELGDLDTDRLETLSSETHEGVFRANRIEALAHLGALSVFALPA